MIKISLLGLLLLGVAWALPVCEESRLRDEPNLEFRLETDVHNRCVWDIPPAERSSRAAGKDSSGSSEEKPAGAQADNSDSSSEEEKTTTVKPEEGARRRRAVGDESNVSNDASEEMTKPVQARPSGAEEEKENSQEGVDLLSYYVQGCEGLEVDSNEVNNETTYIE